MGARILLPLVAVLLVVAGVATWLFTSGEDGPRQAAGPQTEATSGLPAAEEMASLASPGSADKSSATTHRRAEPAQMAPKPKAAVVEEQAPPKPQVVGRIVDKLGNPLSGAEVELSRANLFPGMDRLGDSDDDESVTTGSDGRFAIDAPGSSHRLVSARASGFAPLLPRDVQIPAKGEFDLGDLVLSQGIILSGHVVNANGQPVEGAEIFDSSHNHGMFTSESMMVRSRVSLDVTAADGSFRIESLACGTWKLLVHSDDYPNLNKQGVEDIPGTEVAGLMFQFEASAAISGRVVGLPEDGVGQLTVRARTVMPEGDDYFNFSPPGTRRIDCAADGSFEIRGLRLGEVYALQALETPQGMGAGMILGGGIRSESVQARPGDRGVELVYNMGASLSFRVVDADTGKPISALMVSAGVNWSMPLRDDDGRPKRKFPEGEVEVTGLYPRGESKLAQLEIEATGYKGYEFDGIEFLLGEDLDLGVIRLEPAPVLVVRVTDAKSGVPVTGASVQLTRAPEQVSQSGGFRMEMTFDTEIGGSVDFMRGGNRALTDEFGVATINSIEGTDCTLRVESAGHAPFEIPRLFLPAGERVERDVALVQGGSVLVSVFDPDGRPMSGVKIEHRNPSAGPQVLMMGGAHSERHRTDSAGEVLFANLEPGLHSFRIQDSEGGPSFMGDGETMLVLAGASRNNQSEEWSKVQVTEASRSEILLEASPRGLLDGRVTEGGGVLAGASLTLKKRKQDEALGAFDMAAMFGGGGHSARTDGDGYYSFEAIKPGEYTLEISHPTRALSTERDLEVRDRGGTVEMRFDVNLPVSILEGRITDSEGEPLKDVEVWAERFTQSQGRVMRMIMIDEFDDGASVSFGDESSDGRVRTDGDGFFRLRGVPADVDLKVHANAKFFQEQQSEVVSVGEDDLRDDVDLVLHRAGKIDVLVVTSDGSPSGMAMLFAEYLGEGDVEPERTMVSQSGSAVLDGLRPGPWSLSVQSLGPGMGDPDDGNEGQTITVVAGETATATLDAP